MKTKIVRNLSTALICIFIFAVFILVGGIIYYYRQGLKNAEQILENVSSLVKGTATSELAKSLDTYVSLNNNLAAVSIRIGETLVYVNDNNDVPALEIPAFPLKLFTKNFVTANNESSVITAAIRIINPAEVATSSRIAFLMVLAATAGSIILIAFTKKYPQIDKETAPDSSVPPAVPTAVDESNIPDIPESEPLTFKVENESKPENEAVSETTATQNNNYSGETGFMREMCIERVLDPILINAASDSEDVAFLLITIPGLTRNSETGTEVCACILEQFISPERIFEHGIDSFAVILQNSGAAEAIQVASGLYRKLSEIISGSGTTPVISIGISSKAFRNSIAATTLLSEANQALSRAIENPETPIVALKINPEKYREFGKA